MKPLGYQSQKEIEDLYMKGNNGLPPMPGKRIRTDVNTNTKDRLFGGDSQQSMRGASHGKR